MIRRTSVRLNTHRSATASGRSLTGLHPMRSPCSSSVTTGILLHCQRLSVGQYFCAPCRFPCFPVAAQWAQRKPPFGGDTKEVQLGTFPGSYFRLVHSAPAPAHTPASRTTSDSLCGSSPCGVYSVVFNARCGFALPGTFCRDNAQSATFFRLNDRKQATSLKCRHAVRGSRVYD